MTPHPPVGLPDNGNLTYRFRYGDSDGSERIVYAHVCHTDGGRVTWKDRRGHIVLSEPSDYVHNLSCDEAAGALRPAAEPCSWCDEAAELQRVDVDDLVDTSGHIPDCPHHP